MPATQKATTNKARLRRYIIEGHDVQSAQHFQAAMLSSDGVKGARVALVDGSTTGQKESQIQVKWEGVSSQNNFHYAERCTTAWRAYQVGKGKIVQEGGVRIKGNM